VLKHNVDVNRASHPASVAVITGGRQALTRGLVTTAATVGVIAAGVAVLEVALIPGILIGGAVVLAPSYLSRLWPRRRRRPLLPIALSQPSRSPDKTSPAVPSTMKQAIAKTITYRIIVTSFDFSINYLVIGELATAAGLSAFALVVGPLFYLGHETAWNYFAAADKRLDLTVLLPRRTDTERTPVASGFTISRALAKTITFRTIATTMDFTANFVVVGDLAMAAALSASGFILGPFVYLGHEMAWDHFGSLGERALELPASSNLLPAIG
jgi:uncharacterized membrane protein